MRRIIDFPACFTPMPEARAIGRMFAEKFGVEMPPEKGGKKEYFEWWDRVYAEVKEREHGNE